MKIRPKKKSEIRESYPDQSRITFPIYNFFLEGISKPVSLAPKSPPKASWILALLRFEALIIQRNSPLKNRGDLHRKSPTVKKTICDRKTRQGGTMKWAIDSRFHHRQANGRNYSLQSLARTKKRSIFLVPHVFFLIEINQMFHSHETL